LSGNILKIDLKVHFNFSRTYGSAPPLKLEASPDNYGVLGSAKIEMLFILIFKNGGTRS
jgi:hypothetical protein